MSVFHPLRTPAGIELLQIGGSSALATLISDRGFDTHIIIDASVQQARSLRWER